MTPLLELKSVETLYFDRIYALHGLSLQVKEREIFTGPGTEWGREEHPPPERLARERYRLIKVFTATRAGSRPEDYDQQDAFFLPLRNLAAVIRPGTTISVYMRHDAPGG